MPRGTKNRLCQRADMVGAKGKESNLVYQLASSHAFAQGFLAAFVANLTTQN